jgi:hypothetical protein
VAKEPTIANASRSSAVLLSIVLLSTSAAFCQICTGTITGTVTDPLGAAVSNVQVTVVETHTNFESKATTNEDGIYRVQSLLPGTYRVTFEAGGFKRIVQDGLILRVGDVLPINSALPIGAVSESVEVKAQSTLLETETSATGTGTVTEGNQLYKLNMYQRYITNTLSIVPGVSNQTAEPLMRRRELIEKHVLPKLADPIRYSPILEGSLKDLIASVKAQGP